MGLKKVRKLLKSSRAFGQFYCTTFPFPLDGYGLTLKGQRSSLLFPRLSVVSGWGDEFLDPFKEPIFTASFALQLLVNVSQVPVMSKAQLSVRIPLSVQEKLESYVDLTGTTKTKVVALALVEYLERPERKSLTQRLTELEAQVRELRSLVQTAGNR